MPLVTEFLNGGVVTVRDPSLLQPGELQQADECMYRLNDPAIYRAPGRTSYGLTAGGADAVKALAHLTSDTQLPDQLVAWVGTVVYHSDFTAITGTFAPVTSVGQISCTYGTGGANAVAVSDSPFTYMPIGARVWGDGIVAGTTIKAVVSGTTVTLSDTPTVNHGNPSGSAATLTFDTGIVPTFQDNGPEIADFVQWEGNYYMLPGKDRPVRMYWRSGVSVPGGSYGTNIFTMRPMGMLEVITWGDGTVTGPSRAIGAAWSSILGNHYFWFLLTEIINPGTTDELESAYIANKGRPRIVQILDYTNNYVHVIFPTLQNDGSPGRNRATHWGIYMSDAQSDPSTVPSLATFKRLMTVPTENTTADIKFTNVTDGPKVPTTAAARPSGLPQFNNPGAFTGATVGVASSDSGSNQQGEEVLGSFGFTDHTATGVAITGIEVDIFCAADSSGTNHDNADFFVILKTTGGKQSAPYHGSIGTKPGVVSLGGQFDTWASPIILADMIDGSFQVIIQKAGTNGNQRLTVGNKGVTVKLFYSGGASSDGSIVFDGPSFRVVTYRSQVGTTVNDPANFGPPNCNTGDIYQGQVVLNDLSNEAQIRFSLPDFLNIFLSPTFLSLNPKRKIE